MSRRGFVDALLAALLVGVCFVELGAATPNRPLALGTAIVALLWFACSPLERKR